MENFTPYSALIGGGLIGLGGAILAGMAAQRYGPWREARHHALSQQ
jgi:hypothetical protein